MSIEKQGESNLSNKPGVEAVLINGHTDIELATVQKVKRYLPRKFKITQTWEDMSGDPDLSHPLGQWSTLTTPNNPSVIYDDGAAFCSPVITFDEMGNALHFHSALIDPRDGFASQKYFGALNKLVHYANVIAAIGGMNDCITEYGEGLEVNPIDQVIKETSEKLKRVFPEAKLISLVSKQYKNQSRLSTIVPNNVKARGFMFIPKYIATDGRNHLLAILHESALALRKEYKIR